MKDVSICVFLELFCMAARVKQRMSTFIRFRPARGWYRRLRQETQKSELSGDRLRGLVYLIFGVAIQKRKEILEAVLSDLLNR